YRHQVESLAETGPALLTDSASPYAALKIWIEAFTDFVITKQGLATVLQSDDPCFDPLHSYFLERLVPVCTQLLDAAAEAGEVRAGLDAFELMRGVGGLCAGAGPNHPYAARRLVEF